jgi:protein TonB
MFDLITGKAAHAPRNQSVPILISIAAHVSALGALLLVTVLFVGNDMPVVPEMMQAFIAAPPPPPPPPPPAPAPPPEQRRAEARPAASPHAAPVEAPVAIEPEAPIATTGVGDDEGFPGGVVGGVPGGIFAGVVGGDVAAPPPPPPPAAPVRVGGDLKAPALTYRVEPVYPPVAVAAHVQGTVILEATVNELGMVQDVRVLRSQKLLDQAAMDAVRQWRYSPLMLNGRPASFVLTVVLTFSFKD